MGNVQILQMLLEREEERETVGERERENGGGGGGGGGVVTDMRHAKDACGRRPLHIAALNGHLKMLMMLMTMEEVEVEEMEVEEMAEKGMEERDNEGNTPLALAVSKGHVDVVQYLLDQGADVNDDGCAKGKRTLLHIGVGFGHKEVVSVLLKNVKMIDITKKDVMGVTALELAKKMGHIDIVEMLEECGGGGSGGGGGGGGEEGNGLSCGEEAADTM